MCLCSMFFLKKMKSLNQLCISANNYLCHFRFRILLEKPNTCSFNTFQLALLQSVRKWWLKTAAPTAELSENKSMNGHIYQGVIAQDLRKITPDMIREYVK